MLMDIQQFDNARTIENDMVDLTLRIGLASVDDRVSIMVQGVNPRMTNEYFEMMRTNGQNNFNGWILGRENHLPLTNSNTNARTGVGLDPNMMLQEAINPSFANNYNFGPPPSQSMNYTILNTSSRVGQLGNLLDMGRRVIRRRQQGASCYNPYKRCTNMNCNTNDTPMWRRGPLGPKTLCNACGIRYRKEEYKKIARGANGAGPVDRS